MKGWWNIIGRVLLFEIVIDGAEQEMRLWVARFRKGRIHLDLKQIDPEDSLEKWKHSMGLLSISGNSVVSKVYREEDASIKKITENEELFWYVSSTDTDEERVVSFLRKEVVGEFMERLNKNSIHLSGHWIGKGAAFDKEKFVNDFYIRQLGFSAIRKTSGCMNVVCDVLYYRFRLPVLLLFFVLLLGNFFANTHLRKAYEVVQIELNGKQRTDKAQRENQEKQGRLQAEYQKIPNCSFALIADRIASYVPATVRLDKLSVFPLDNMGNSIVNRNKELKLKTGTIVVKGEVEVPGSITLFTQFLGSDRMFSKVEILSLVKQKDSFMYNFELLITL